MIEGPLHPRKRTFGQDWAKGLLPTQSEHSRFWFLPCIIPLTKLFIGGHMTLEQYAQIGEIVAATAVIASLIYVARELHQNTNQTRITVASTQVDITKHMVSPVIADRNLAELWVKGDSEFDSLDAVDQQRLIFLEWQALNAWNNSFRLRKKNLLSDQEWRNQIWIWKNIGQRQAVRESWKIFRDSYETSFQDLMSEYLD